MVEDPSADASVPTVSKFVGEQREVGVNGGGGEEQAECSKELKGMGPTRVWDDVDRNGENATSALRGV